MTPDEIGHEHTDKIVCPYCGHKHSDMEAYELFKVEAIDDVVETDCSACSAWFVVKQHLNITYSTSRIKENTKMEALNVEGGEV